VDAITARLAEIIPTLTVSCTDADHDGVEEVGGGLYSDYTVHLTIDGQTHIIGGWVVCGWIQAGASQDLDGRGLANWGTSQRGGWRCCDSDGTVRGNPTVESADYSVTIRPGYGRPGSVDLTIADLLGLTEAEQTIIAEHLNLDDPLAALAERIEDALSSADRGVSEPDGEDVWDALSGGEEVVKDAVRVGKWGGYALVSVLHDGDYTTCHQTGDDDWQSAVRRAAADHAEAEVARLLARLGEQD
jgi:hypothetical protein